MEEHELRILTKEVTELVRKVGYSIKQEIRQVGDQDVKEKRSNDFVTYVDKASEETIVQKLKNLFPEAGFITEEGTATEQKEYTWVVDPLDGTTNFIHGIPSYSISIALRRKEKTIMGVVYEPNADECFYSWEGHPAYLNEKEIQVSTSETMEDSLIATGFPYEKDETMDSYLKVLKDILMVSHGIRRLGSAAVDLVYVACGRFEAFYEIGLHSWDVAAGAFIVQQAGGKVTDFSSGDNYVFGRQILASNSYIHEQMLKTINNSM
ncbi:MAG: inositol monophosphatase [Bacteroidales bacterium]|nr:inositol monophosphatase [Bacteroidales bacterium]MCF8334218.1 inositol monophosphatase [Bacteroidales bacterium]